MLGLREIGERVGLHLSAVGQCGSTRYGAPDAHDGEITEGLGELN